MENRELRRKAGAAYAGQQNPEVFKALGPEARKIAESVTPAELKKLAHPELQASADRDGTDRKAGASADDDEE